MQFDGNEIKLTLLEFGILELLALRAGHTVTRTEISDHLYGFDLEPNRIAIDVHVAVVRRKLEQACLPRPSHTRRGMGHRLAEQE